MKFLKFAAAMLCCVFAMTIVSCDKDDDDAPTPSAFKFNPAKVEVAVGASANVTVSGGTEPYTVASSDVKTATVKVSKNIITVTGVKEGKVTLNVSDKNKKVGMLAVTVKKVTALEEINPVLGELVVTVGVPVSDAGGKVRAVVLLHSPVQGMREAAWEGIRILILSCVVAMVLVFVLSMLFSWKFTKPLNKMRLVAEKMSEHDYTERCNIDQKDEIGQLAQTLDGLGERLLEADQASKKLEQLRRDFIANISHELRTPVTVIRGSLEALCDRIVTEPQEVEDYHRQMLAETLFLQRLINDLLDLSRLQNTDFPIEKEPVNLCDVVQDVVRSSQRLGQQKNITIQLSLDTPVYIIEGDYGRLRQMLLIFLDNSIKFSPEQSKIEVALLGSRLTVTDHGCGVKQEELPHVFDRFYKTRGETNKSGSGLGLAISKQISERHGIGLTMTSIPGEATSVVLQLPPALKKGSTD